VKPLSRDPSRWTLEELSATQETGGLANDRRARAAARQLASSDEDEKRETDEQLEGLRLAWSQVPANLRGPKRARALRKVVLRDCRQNWGKRFPAWRACWRSAVTGAWLSRAARSYVGAPTTRSLARRAAFVIVWDRICPIDLQQPYQLPRDEALDAAIRAAGLPSGTHAIPPSGNLRGDGSSRFLSVTEKTWASLLGGNWPSVESTATPEDVFRAERAAIKKAQQRYPLPPLVTYEGEALGFREHPVRRGVQRKDVKRIERARLAASAGDLDRLYKLNDPARLTRPAKMR
jgi:hypothetical protein